MPEASTLVNPGDTYESISRRFYGNEGGASRIRQANPGVSEPLVLNTVIRVPAAPDAVAQQLPSSTDPNEIAVMIGGNRFLHWETVSITRSLDAVDTFAITAPNEDRTGLIDFFVPFAFEDVLIGVGSEALIRGTMVEVNPAVSAGTQTIAASGYSRPGVLWDCTMPASSVPFEKIDITLEQIAETLMEPWGIPVVFDGDPGPAFKQAALTPETKVGPFLARLARQRKLVIGSNPDGALVFRDGSAGPRVARLREGRRPLVSVTPQFRPREYYSHVTGFEPALMGLNGQQHTVDNPRLQAVRPLNFTAQDSPEGEIVPSVSAKAGRMFANAVAYIVEVPTWRTHNADASELWSPGQTVRVSAPSAFIRIGYNFTIRSVTMTRTKNEETARLELILPGSFAGQIPDRMPWE